MERVSSSAHTTRSTDSATCATTNAERARSRGALPHRSRLSVDASSRRVAATQDQGRRQGPSPPQGRTRTAMTRQSMPRSHAEVRFGIVGIAPTSRSSPPMRARARRPHHRARRSGSRRPAGGRPARAPRRARAAIPSSGARVTPRASSMPAALKHAISRTRPTSANSRPTKRLTIDAAVHRHRAGGRDADPMATVVVRELALAGRGRCAPVRRGPARGSRPASGARSPSATAARAARPA